MRTTPVLGALLGAVAILAASHPIRSQTITKTRRVDVGQQPHFANAPGWEWMVQPMAFRVDKGKFTSQGEDEVIVTDSTMDADGGLRVFFVQMTQGPQMGHFPDLRFVAIDAAGGRHLFSEGRIKHESGDSKGRFAVRHATFTLDPKVLAPDKAAYIGIERLAAKPR